MESEDSEQSRDGLFPHFLQHTESLASSGSGYLPSCRTMGLPAPSLTTPQPVCLVSIHLGYAVAPETSSSLRILKGRDSSSLPSSASTWLPTTVPIWRFPCCGFLPV